MSGNCFPGGRFPEVHFPGGCFPAACFREDCFPEVRLPGNRSPSCCPFRHLRNPLWLPRRPLLHSPHHSLRILHSTGHRRHRECRLQRSLRHKQHPTHPSRRSGHWYRIGRCLHHSLRKTAFLPVNPLCEKKSPVFCSLPYPVPFLPVFLFCPYSSSVRIPFLPVFVLLSELGSAFECPEQGHFINILQVAADRNSAGDPGHTDTGRFDKFADVHGCCLAFET